MTEQKQEIPEGYKQTEVGIIPESWEVVGMDQVTAIIDPQPDHRTPPECFVGEPYIGISDFLNEKSVNWDASRKIISAAVDKQESRFRIKSGDIIFGKIGTIGVPKFLPKTQFRYALSANVLLLQPKIEPFFLMSFLYSDVFQKAVNSELHSTSQAAFGINKMRLMLIPLPPIKEQTAIANALSDVDALINELEKIIAKKQAIKTATMQQLLTGKTRLPQFALREDGTLKGYKASELGEIPEDWGVESIDDNCRTFSGGTPSTANKGFYGGDIKWITSSDLNKGMIWDVQGRITNSGLESSAAKMIDANTFLIALYGATAGVCAISRIGAAINQAVLAVIPTSHNPTYLFYWFTKNKEEIIKTYTQGGQPNLSGDIIRAIKLPFPPNKEQTKIATILSDMDGEVLLLEQRLNKTRQIKQGMMQELLTGKTRLI